MIFKIGVLKNFAIFRGKLNLFLKSLFNKVSGLKFSCEHYKIFKNSFFHKIPPVAASEKFINFPGK